MMRDSKKIEQIVLKLMEEAEKQEREGAKIGYTPQMYIYKRLGINNLYTKALILQLFRLNNKIDKLMEKLEKT